MKVSKVLLFFILFLVFFISTFVYLSLNPYVLYVLKGERDFNEVIVEIDSYLLNGNLKGVEQTIRFYSYYADTESKWLSLIKRAKVYSTKVKHYLLMRDILDLSVQSLPGNLKLRALEVYSKLRVGAVLEAYDIAKQYLLGYEEYKHLYDEAFIKSLILSYDIRDIKDFLVKIEQDRDVLAFETIGLNLQNNAFLINAMLLYIEKKDLDSAKRILLKIAEDKDFAKELAYISYGLDNLDFVIANLKLIHNDDEPSLIFLLADAYLKKGDIHNAKNEYLKLYTHFPDYSMMVYLGLAFIAKKENDLQRAIAYLNKANEKFKENEIISYYLANAYFVANDYFNANEIARKYKDNPLFFKLYFVLNYSNLKYEAKKSFLWRLFYRSNYSTDIAQFLAWNLLLCSDLKDLDLFFRLYNPVGEIPEWYYFYRFYYFFLKKDLIAAENVIFEDQGGKYLYGVYYNLGVLKFYQKNYKESEEYFNKAVYFLPFGLDDKSKITLIEREDVAKVYLKRGINYLYLGEFEKGREAILTSHSFYETNKGKLYMNMMEILKERN
ncbi:N utilization substance protein B [Borrelia anserina]|uniref:N utilization substance protein B n=2 Tax=Borrelia anserina TaxID=143 RepID=A0ABN4U9B7_BORAN|nr:tetratricopeptide repeat protein [Borrelia anserina]AHH08068.1 Putative cytosolic protein [Borrelia anserina BA2]AHH08925.1 Putative cytosolic protein [Borrelia anserina BA2]APR64614.1 N utilization substance protein B [Borrelia anserina Es]UPA06528.1 N utilization substance protein B [Borrelia anserina]